MSTLISAQNLGITFGSRTILHGVNFAIERGELVSVVGPNGSGKTSFLRALANITKPTSGKITHAPNLRIGYVPQKLALDKTLPITAKRFLTLGGHDADAIMADLNIQALADLQLADLSGGELQKVLLARALLANPDILMLDEPTQGMDQPATADFYMRLADIQQNQGCAVLMISHELHVVMSQSDRVICLNGHICCEGTPNAVADAPEYQALFGKGTKGTLALYRHEHDHDHSHDHAGHNH